MRKPILFGLILTMFLLVTASTVAAEVRLDPVSEVIPWGCFTAECDQRNVACTVAWWEEPIIASFDTSAYIGTTATLHYTTGMNTYADFYATYEVWIDGQPRLINEIGATSEYLYGCAGVLSRTVTFTVVNSLITVQFVNTDEGWLTIGLTDNSSATTEAYLTIEGPTIDIKPDTLNLNSKGNFITAYIELPEGYDVASIDCASLMLEGSIPAASCDRPLEAVIGDYDIDGIADFMVKFDRANVQSMLVPGSVALTVTGTVSSVPFEGSDVIIASATGKDWHQE